MLLAALLLIIKLWNILFLTFISVEQLTAAAVNSYAEIESKEQEGTRNRTVAATQMNATSSRAHTIVAINFTQKAPNEAGESMTKQATINLVDLAGRLVLWHLNSARVTSGLC